MLHVRLASKEEEEEVARREQDCKSSQHRRASGQRGLPGPSRKYLVSAASKRLSFARPEIFAASIASAALWPRGCAGRPTLALPLLAYLHEGRGPRVVPNFSCQGLCVWAERARGN